MNKKNNSGNKIRNNSIRNRKINRGEIEIY